MNGIRFYSLVSFSGIVSLIRVLLGVVFLLAGILKTSNIISFHSTISNFGLLTPNVLPFISYVLIMSEIILGLTLLLKIKPILFSNVASFLLIFFTTLIISKIIEGESFNCNCFGVFSENKIGLKTILRNVILLLITIFLSAYYHVERNHKKIENKHERILRRKEIIAHFYKSVKVLLITFAFIFISLQCVILAQQNLTLKERLAIIIRNKNVVKIGDKINALTLIDMNGMNKKVFDIVSCKTIVFLFSIDCEACSLNFPVWQQLTELFNKEKKVVNTIAISLDSISTTKKFVSKLSFSNSIYCVHNKGIFLEQFKTMLTPQTILIDDDSKVEGVWLGTLTPFHIYGIMKRL
ncbi:MAG: redoxin domain-containing protein [Actinobacteria bacterium]|nr:redoxin domain-containing protein [Actinomycetota bacterium]